MYNITLNRLLNNINNAIKLPRPNQRIIFEAHRLRLRDAAPEDYFFIVFFNFIQFSQKSIFSWGLYRAGIEKHNLRILLCNKLMPCVCKQSSHMFTVRIIVAASLRSNRNFYHGNLMRDTIYKDSLNVIKNKNVALKHGEKNSKIHTKK